MPVSAGTVQFSYTGDGSTTVFPFPSRFLTNSDIIVGVDGVQVFTGFTVTGAGDDAGGNVTFSVAPVGATAITLIRAPAINQLLDFVNNQTVLAQNIDNGLDKLTIVAQYLNYLLERTLRLSQFDTALSGNYDLQGKKIVNSGAATGINDLTRLADVQAILSSAGNVPSPLGSQVGFLLQALSAGTFGWAEVPLPSDVPYVIVIAGQSNAAGVNAGGPNPASSLVQTWDAVTGAWGGSDYTGLPWSRSTPNGNSGNNNYALARAHRIADDTHRPVYIVFDAVGGTSIDEWVASGTSSTRYAALKAKVEAALATLPGKTTIDELIWAQGEEDFTDDFATHLGNLTLLRNQLRAETWCGYTPPIYMTGPSPLHDRYQWQNAMQYFCARVDSRCIFVPSNGLRTEYQANGVTDVPGAGDFTHFLGESLWEAGYNRIADAAIYQTPADLFYGRGTGPATPADPTALTTFSSIVSKDSWTAQNAPIGPAATGSISWGFECNADGNYSYTLGYQNVTDNLCSYTILAGREITAGATGDYSAGFGFQNTISSPYAFAAGRGHTIADDHGAAVGSFSEYTTGQTDDVRFQVGSGSSSGARGNAFAARASGILEAKNLPTYANNAAALAGSMVAGQIYRTATGELRIVV